MQKEIEITIAPEHVENQQIILHNLAKALNINVSDINNHQILKRSIDARSRKVIYRLQVRAYIGEDIILPESNFSYQNVIDKKDKERQPQVAAEPSVTRARITKVG